MTTDIVIRLRLDGSELSLEAAKEIDFLRECLTEAYRPHRGTSGAVSGGQG